MDDASFETLRRAAAHVLVDDPNVPTLADRDAHHLFRVLRVRDGQTVTVTDGRGAWRPCRAVGGSIVPDGEVVVEPDPEQPPSTLFVAVPKQDRPDWIVQKATEIGVDRIVFLHTERSVVRWDAERARRRLEKLAVVAAEATMQCRRVRVPDVAGPLDARDVLGPTGPPIAEPGGRPMAAGDRSLAIGPEGGWSAAEIDRAVDRVDLGPNVLRVETAALVGAVALARIRST